MAIIQNHIKFGIVKLTRKQREIVALSVSTPLNEMDFINRMLGNDSKNYHAWAYRQFVVSNHNLWDLELKECSRFIDEDIRNNSAWNQRYFVITKYFVFTKSGSVDETVISNEIDYAITKIHLAPHNESPWNYVQGCVFV